MSAQIHRCSICGATGEWDKSWSWYGSFADNGVEAKLCSPPCSEAFTPERVRNGVLAR